MTDQEYTHMLTTDVEDNDLTNALEKLTVLHEECNWRTMEYWSAKRTSRSIQSRKYIAAVHAVCEKFDVNAVYTRNNRYEVKEWNRSKKSV